MPKEAFCWQQMVLELKDHPNTPRMSFSIKDFLWYFQKVTYSGFPSLSIIWGTQTFSQIRPQALWHKGYPNCVSSICHNVSLSHTPYRNKDSLIGESHRSLGQTFPVRTHIIRYRSLTTTFYTCDDSYKLWKTTACPHCCQSLPSLPLHQTPHAKYKNPTLPMPGVCSCQVNDTLMQVIHDCVSPMNQMLQIFL